MPHKSQMLTLPCCIGVHSKYCFVLDLKYIFELCLGWLKVGTLELSGDRSIYHQGIKLNNTSTPIIFPIPSFAKCADSHSIRAKFSIPTSV